MRQFLVLLFAGALLAGLAGVIWSVSQGEVYRFAGVAGPDEVSAPPPMQKASISDFDHGSDHRLAILVTDPNSGWLGLARGLKSHGIPFRMTTDVASALRHKVVFAYPMISGRALKSSDFAKLAQHVHQGGYLLAFDVEGGGLESLFGIAARISRSSYSTSSKSSARKTTNS